ncbi:MAG TPA: TlpA disulfide reductase family protein [Salinivirgaceae bacterium]|nr:TlpA disulfide reductase family protein [Salinivirgaceae bacterium]
MRWLAIAILLLSVQTSLGQPTVKVYNFRQLEKKIYPSADSIYVINFWATWCSPCVKELPEFIKAEQQLYQDKIRFIYVSLDFEEHIQTRLIPFLERMNFKSEVVVLKQDDADQWIPKIDKSWSGSLPATLFISRKKRIFHEGTLTYEQLIKQIKTLKNYEYETH